VPVLGLSVCSDTHVQAKDPPLSPTDLRDPSLERGVGVGGSDAPSSEVEDPLGGAPERAFSRSVIGASPASTVRCK
jgi:hypothetical protein